MSGVYPWIQRWRPIWHTGVMADIDSAREKARSRGLGDYDRHIFLCIGPDCCSEEEGQKAWGQLKKAAAKLNGSGESGRIYRTKVGCLRICEFGPTAVTRTTAIPASADSARSTVALMPQS